MIIDVIGIVFYSAGLLMCIIAIPAVMSKNDDTKDFYITWTLRVATVAAISATIIFIYAIYLMMTGSFWFS